MSSYKKAMKLSDLVRSECDGKYGIVMEEAEYEGEVGTWLWCLEYQSWGW